MPKEYPKIDTLFERQPDFTVDVTKLKKPVYGEIKRWQVLEKVDGTNVRICLVKEDAGDGACMVDTVKILARTDNGQLPGDLSSKLYNFFTAAKLREIFPDGDVILFGEGYGAGIQKVGKDYRNDKGFILFDVLVGEWWLDWKDVVDVANKLGIDHVPDLGLMTLEEIIEHVRNDFPSKVGSALAEGVVAKPIQALFDKSGHRLILKLKTSDFRAGKR